MTYFGCSVPMRPGDNMATAITRAATNFTFDVARLYIMDPDWTAMCTQVVKTGARLALSFKGWDENQVKALIAACPTDRVTYLTYFHEPEDNIDAARLSLAVWQARQVRLCELIQAAGRVGQVIPTVILMAWTSDPRSTHKVADYASSEVVTALKQTKGVWGWDSYLTDLTGSNVTTIFDYKTIYARLAKVSADLGLPWAVFETGIITDGRAGDPAAIGQAWRDVFTFLGSGAVPAPVCFLYWNQGGAGPAGLTFVVDDKPAILGAWKQATTTFAAASGATPAGGSSTPATPTPVTYTQAQLDQAVADAVAAQKAADAAALTATVAAAVAAQKSADDAVLATTQANATAALAAERALGDKELADALAAAAAHLTSVTGKVDYILARAQKDIAATCVATRASVKAAIA